MKKFVAAVLALLMGLLPMGFAEAAWETEWRTDERVIFSEWSKTDMFASASCYVTIRGGYLVHIDMEEIEGVPDGVIDVFKGEKWILTAYFIDEDEYNQWMDEIIKQCLEGKQEIMV